MMKLLLVCLTALFGAHVEGLGPCNCNLDNILKKYEVFPLAGLSEIDLHVRCETADLLNTSNYDKVNICFGPVIENEANVEVIQIKGQEIVNTITDLKVYQYDPTATITLENYPIKGVNTTTVFFECVKGTGVFVTHTCGYGDGIPSVFISTLKNERIPRAIYRKCKKIADNLASCRVELFCLSGERCGAGGH